MRPPSAITWPRAAAIAARLLLLCCAALGSGASGAPDEPITLRIANAGAEPLRCVVLFGHWVSRDTGVIAAGASHSLAMIRRTSDRSLYIARSDGRPMMIENVVCGTDSAWAQTLGQIPLLAVRTAGERALSTRCRVAERVVCEPPAAR